MLAFVLNKTPCITSVLEAEPGPGNYKHHGVGRTEIALPYSKGSIGRIRKMFKKVELSVSSYDTAWLAMVPTVGSPQNPCFPQCLKWLLDNQHHDGSWCLPSRHDLMIKDSLLSTLACVLALRKWEIGEEHVSKGIEFVGSNFGAIMDKKQLSPMGFNIIFPSMVEHAKNIGLKLPLSPNCFDKLHKNRNLELERVSRCNTKGSKSYLAYVSEGLTESYDPAEILKFQRKNGSLFNSPATTAALSLHSQDDKCLDYLHSLFDKYDSAVPTIYPIDVCIRLCMVDRIERLGISRHFVHEIKSVLDETYRCWLQRDEEIFLDMQTCSLAFRLLKTNGYEVSSGEDALADFNEEKHFFESSSGSQNLNDIYSVLELYKASEITTSPDDLVLETLHSWTSRFLKQGLENGTIPEENFRKQVENALEFPYDVSVGRLDNRRNIESYNVDEIQILKTLHRCTNIANPDFLQLAVEDYNFCQCIHQKELKNLERWAKESRLDEHQYARQKLTYLYFMIACNLFSPELSDARITWTKNSFLVNIIDDFFDAEGSKEELVNLIDLVEKWDCTSVIDGYCSNRVEIIYTAFYETINNLGALASTRQGQDVTSHLVHIWLVLLKSMMQEFEWATDMSMPTLNEYIDIAHISVAIGPCVLITLYFLGTKLSEGIISSQECNSLYKLTSICCRLLNDTKTFQREAGEGKLNSVLLYAIHESGPVTEQEALGEISRIIECNKRDLLKLVLQTKGSIFPNAWKNLFWNTYRITRLLYRKNDGLNSVEMRNFVNDLIFRPINL